MKDLNSIYFEGKEPNETIVMLLRRHKVALIRQILQFAAGLVLVGVIVGLIGYYTSALEDPSRVLFGVIILVASLIVLFLLLFIYHAWVDFYLDIWFITDQRIIAMDQQGLFHRSTSELRLDRIQDVSSQVKGPLATLFRYGTVQVRTASEEDKFYFTEVPRAELVARTILELHEQYVQRNTQPTMNHATHQQSTVTHHIPRRQS